MISDRDTNIVYLSERINTDSKYPGIAENITRIFDYYKIEYRFLPKTKDIWARDYMPIQISDNEFIEYRYDPDYLQGKSLGRRGLKTYPDIVCDTIGLKTIKSDLIIDGGNVIKSSDCVILTDKIIIENKHFYSEPDLIDCLKQTFSVEKVVIIPQDPDDEFGHADGMLRFIDDRTVLIYEFYKTFEKIFEQLEKAGLKWKFLSFDVNNYDDRNWAYINFLQTKDLILLPKLNIEEDDQAFEQISSFFPEYAEKRRIAQVDMTSVIKEGGALNCMTWTKKEIS